MNDKAKLLINFSGGRTSAYMTYKILKKYKNDFEIKVVFANTGQEHENTLRFVKQCDEYFGFETTWVETIVHEGRKGRMGRGQAQRRAGQVDGQARRDRKLGRRVEP